MIPRSLIGNSLLNVQKINYINRLHFLIIIIIPFFFFTSYINYMFNVSTRSFCKSFDFQDSISTISHIADNPSTSRIIISTVFSSPINNHEITVEIILEEVSQIDISSISTIASIMNSNGPNGNIINEILISIRTNLNRQVNVRLSFNSTVHSLVGAVRTSKSCIIGQITDSIDCNPKPNHSRSARSNIG